MKIRLLVAAAALASLPSLTFALAQGTLAHSADAPAAGAAASDGVAPDTAIIPRPATPGDTGRTVVPGSNSTVAGDAKATRETQTGVIGQTQ